MVQNSNLILHCGGERVTRQTLEAVPVPGRTDTWVPIRHTLVLDTVIDALEKQGLKVAGMEHALSRSGMRYFGVLQTSTRMASGEVVLVIGVRNSMDKSMSAGFCAGEQVFVCDNLAFAAEYSFLRKHTPLIMEHLPRIAIEGVAKLEHYIEGAEARIKRMKDWEFDDLNAHDMVIKAADRGCITYTEIRHTLDAWRAPSHPEFEPRTAWSLLNSFTEVMRDRIQKKNPDTAAKRTLALNALFRAHTTLVNNQS